MRQDYDPPTMDAGPNSGHYLLLTAIGCKFIMMSMAARTEEEQTEHDLVIEATVEQYAKSAKYVLFANPGTEKNVAVGHQYPDIIVTEKGSTKVRLVIEVETTDTVGDQEVDHWRALSSLGPPLYLLVPYTVTADAERLCSESNIKCHHGYYHEDEMGRFKIVLQKDPGPHANSLHHPPH
jgi:hypothetical protein